MARRYFPGLEIDGSIKCWITAFLLAGSASTFGISAVAQDRVPQENEAQDADVDGHPEVADAKPPEEPPVKLGLHFNNPGAMPGYTLLSPMQSTKTYLMDMEGRVVRTWDCGCRPALCAYLLENGNLLRPGTIDEESPRPERGGGPGGPGFGRGPGAGGRIQEFTWDGDVVWDYTFPGDGLFPHHDVCRLPNGNTLVICWDKKTRDEAIDAGRAPNAIGDEGLQPDCLIEIKPTGKTTGEIVWKWHLWDHLIQDRDSSKPNYGDVGAHPELVDINYGEGLAPALANPDTVNQLAAIGYVGAPGGGGPPRINADWTHFNGVAYNEDLDQVMISVHGFSEIWIIDHSTTTEEAAGHTGGRYGKGGDLLYRWGNPITYRAGTEDDRRLFKQHNAHWIAKGLPGAGNILLFNNENPSDDGNYSSADEIVLPMNASGGYDREEGKPFGPREAVWSYTAPRKQDFHSNFISGAHRLANGNTLICSGANGTVFEVTPAKEMVWKYVNPTKGGPGPGGFGPFGDFPRFGELNLPSFVREQLKLSDEQKEQLEAISTKAKEDFEALLTEDQKKLFEEIMERGPFGGGGPFGDFFAGGPGRGGPGFGPPGGGGPGFGPPGGGGPNFGPPGAGGPGFGPPDGGGPNFGRPGNPPRGGVGDAPSDQPNFGPPGDQVARADNAPGDGRPDGRGGPGRGGPGRGGRGRGGPPGGGPPGGSSLFRAYRYALDYPGLAGRDLTPGKTLAEIAEAEPDPPDRGPGRGGRDRGGRRARGNP